jgi:hypothetical protein
VRTAQALIGLGTLMLAATALEVKPAGAACGVFARHPCFSSVCGVFGRYPCYPDYWIGQDLRLTIESASTVEPAAASGDSGRSDGADHKLDTLRAMFAALRACWIPPAKDEARAGMQMSVRFAFKRSGEIIATPRVTYVSPGASPETRETYLHAINAALERCTPLPFTEGLGGAVAGRPIAIRFVDNRDNL